MKLWSAAKNLIDWGWPTISLSRKKASPSTATLEPLLAEQPQVIAKADKIASLKTLANEMHNREPLLAQGSVKENESQVDNSSSKSADGSNLRVHRVTTITKPNDPHPTVQINPPLPVLPPGHHIGRVNAHGQHAPHIKPGDKTYRPPSETGGYIRLTHGVTYYELHGFQGDDADNKETVVLLHGLSWWSFTWEMMAPYLVKNNCKVITFDFYGRGLSAAPRDARYDNELLTEQTRELLLRLGRKEKITLVGFSMGGGVAGTFASKYPEMLNRLVLIGPVGTPVQMPFSAKVIACPVVGWWIYWAFAKLAMKRSLHTDKCRSDFARPEKVEHLLDRYVAYSEWCIEQKEGFFEALYSTTLNFPFSDLVPVYSKIPGSLPVLLLWGEKDHLVPLQNHQILLQAVPHAQFILIRDAGHTCYLEEPEVVHKHITDFISKTQKQHNNRGYVNQIQHYFHHKPVHIPHHAHHTNTHSGTPPTTDIPATQEPLAQSSFAMNL